jgi:hypothetical protein
MKSLTVSLIVLTAAMTCGLFPAAVNAQTPDSSAGAIPGAQSAQITPVITNKSVFKTAAPPSAAQLKAAEAHMERIRQAWAARKEGPPGTLPPSPDAPPKPGSQTSPGPNANLPGTFTVFRNSIAGVSPAGFSSNINEPSHAAAGRNTFMTWNWWAAVSIDGGATWDGVNPFADFADFCCDQDVLYDRGRDMILWERLGIPDANGNNVLKISRTNNGGATWCTYSITGATVGFGGNWYDYPKLATSNNYLYITANMFNAAGSFQRMLLMRWPLDAMQSCSGVGFNFWTNTTGWSWEPVQGARQVMYLGDTQNSAGTFRVYSQPESNTTLSFIDRAIPAWTFTNGNAVCTTSNGTNPCARADQRIVAAVVANNTSGGLIENGVLTFFWNVAQGGSFPKPYAEAASFRESDKAYIRRPFIWNSTYAWFYPSAAVNERGDIGGSIYLFGTALTPYVYAFIDDDYNGDPPGWEVVSIATSSGGSSGNNWGDYSMTRPYYPGGTAWGTSVYTKNASNVSDPRFIIFGRSRDQRNILRWWNQ